MSPPEYALGTRLTVRFRPWNALYAPPRRMDVPDDPERPGREPLEFELEVCGEGSRFGLSATFKVKCSPNATPLQRALLRLMCLPDISERRGYMIKVYDQRIMPGPFGPALDRQCEERFVNEALIYSEFSSMLFDDDPKAPQVPFFYGSIDFDTPNGLVKGLLLENIPHLTFREYIESAATCPTMKLGVMLACRNVMSTLKPVTALGFVNPRASLDSFVLEYDPAEKTKAETDPSKLFAGWCKKESIWFTPGPDPWRVTLNRVVMIDFAQYRRRYPDETDLEWGNYCDEGTEYTCQESIYALVSSICTRQDKRCAFHGKACREYMQNMDPDLRIDGIPFGQNPFLRLEKPVLTMDQKRLKFDHLGRWGEYAYRPYDLHSKWRYWLRVIMEETRAWEQDRPSLFMPDETDLDYDPTRLKGQKYLMRSVDPHMEAAMAVRFVYFLCFLLWYWNIRT